MLRSPSTKLAFGVLAAVLFVVALLGIVYKYAEQRTRMRVHVGAATGGDPLRGESMFIQYGCGSCHAIKGVRTATGGVGPPLDGIALRVIIAGGFRTRPTTWKSGSAIRSMCRQEPRCPTSRGGWGRAGHHRLPLHSREIVSADGRRATAFGASRARSIRHHSRQPPPACS